MIRFLSVASLLLAAGVARADTITLDSGATIQGDLARFEFGGDCQISVTDGDLAGVIVIVPCHRVASFVRTAPRAPVAVSTHAPAGVAAGTSPAPAPAAPAPAAEAPFLEPLGAAPVAAAPVADAPAALAAVADAPAAKTPAAEAPAAEPPAEPDAPAVADAPAADQPTTLLELLSASPFDDEQEPEPAAAPAAANQPRPAPSMDAPADAPAPAAPRTVKF